MAKVAKRLGRRRSDVLREATLAYVEVAESMPTRPANAELGQLGQLGQLIGSLRSGRRDLAENHSAILRQMLRTARSPGSARNDR